MVVSGPIRINVISKEPSMVKGKKLHANVDNIWKYVQQNIENELMKVYMPKINQGQVRWNILYLVIIQDFEIKENSFTPR